VVAVELAIKQVHWVLVATVAAVMVLENQQLHQTEQQTEVVVVEQTLQVPVYFIRRVVAVLEL
jgi:hypothetical protein